jgi:hypothetical protein
MVRRFQSAKLPELHTSSEAPCLTLSPWHARWLYSALASHAELKIMQLAFTLHVQIVEGQ